MALPDDYLALLSKVASVFAAYEAETGFSPVLVGGAAAAIQTAGLFMSGGLDIVAANDEAFGRAMLENGFVEEKRTGRLRGGFYHPDHAPYGIELVSGSLFDGRSDPRKLLRLTVRRGEAIVLPSIEDLIADRLAQYAIASITDPSRLEQAKAMLRMSISLDRTYMKRRIIEEGGDPALVGL